MKICLFQGTFNPIHNAHLSICKYAKEYFDFDKIILIPAAKPPHKDFDENLSFHRLNMAKIAAEGINYIEVSDIEYQRTSLSYTVPTVKQIYKKYDIDEKLNFIIGTDAFLKIESWYKTEELKELVDFVLFAREDTESLSKDDSNLLKLKQKGYNYKMMKLPYQDVSSTQIRDNISNSVPINTLVPNGVKNYIEKHGLYNFRGKTSRDTKLAQR